MTKTGLLTYSNAIVSSDGRFRYSLIRRWKTLGPNICFLMLNPSTADAYEDDPTVRRCMKFAQVWGYSGLIIVNMFAYRSKSPRNLKDHVTFIGSMNDYHVIEAVASSNQTVCAWGYNPLAVKRARQIGRKLEENYLSDKLYCLGKTSGRAPRHPLFVSQFTTLKRFTCPTSLLRARIISRRNHVRHRTAL